MRHKSAIVVDTILHIQFTSLYFASDLCSWSCGIPVNSRLPSSSASLNSRKVFSGPASPVLVALLVPSREWTLVKPQIKAFYYVQILPFVHSFPFVKSCFVCRSRKAGSVQEEGSLALLPRISRGNSTKLM